MQKTIFCANCQADMLHTAKVANNEIIFACDGEGCDRVIKFPAGVSGQELTDMVAAHKAANHGLSLMRTEEDLIANGHMSTQQVNEALAAIEALS
jgi:hypothetical protein